MDLGLTITHHNLEHLIVKPKSKSFHSGDGGNFLTLVTPVIMHSSEDCRRDIVKTLVHMATGYSNLMSCGIVTVQSACICRLDNEQKISPLKNINYIITIKG